MAPFNETNMLPATNRGGARAKSVALADCRRKVLRVIAVAGIVMHATAGAQQGDAIEGNSPRHPGRMNRRDLVTLRLRNQLLTRAGLRRPEDVVSWMGAVQAQEYEPARWGVGLRMRDATLDADVARAFDAGRILRTHVMRPTWHFVTPADIVWLQKLTGARVQRLSAPYNQRLGPRHPRSGARHRGDRTSASRSPVPHARRTRRASSRRADAA